MKITIEIDDDIIRRAIGSAKIDYWTSKAEWIDRAGLTLRIVEDDPDPGEDDGEGITLTPMRIAEGVRVLAEKFPHHFADLIAEKGDMYTGDLLIQCACFGEEKYA